jgi:hypothetical protein
MYKVKWTVTSRGPGKHWLNKLGQVEILELREEAREKLGNRFDLRAFHDEVVGNGPLRLDTLRSTVEAWAEQSKRAHSLQGPEKYSPEPMTCRAPLAIAPFFGNLP